MLVESIEECEVAIFPAWHQELPVQAGQAYFPNRVYSIGSDHSARPSVFQSSRLLRSHTPLRLVLANKGDYRRVLTGSAPPIIVQNISPLDAAELHPSSLPSAWAFLFS
jgi:hypothetical protein